MNETFYAKGDSYKPAKYNLTIDHRHFLTPRLYYSLKVLYRNAGIRAEKALGPSDFKHEDDWKAAKVLIN